MTNREKINYLKRYRQLDMEIDRMLEEKTQFFARATKITPFYSDMPKGPVSENRVQTAVERMVELEHQIDEKIDRLVEIKAEIEGVIAKVPDNKLQTLLAYRYINGYTWEKIAVKMSYCYMQVCRLHGKALDKIEM